MTTPYEQGLVGVDVDGAGIDMFPGPAGEMMTRIADALKNARDGWHRAEGRIESLEGKLGDGPMGKEFREQYNPATEKIGEFITDMVERLEKLSKAGTEAVPTYVNQDQAAGQHFEF
jgi:hypothetical protein